MRIATTPGGGQSKWQRRNTTTLSVMTSFEVDDEGIEGDGVVVGREETKRFLSLWPTRIASVVLGGSGSDGSGGWRKG